MNGMPYPAFTRTGVAGVVNDFTASVTVVAYSLSLYLTKGCALYLLYAARTVTNRAGGGGSAFFTTRSAAIGTVIYLGELNIFFAAKSRFFKRYINNRRCIVTSARCVGVAPAAAAETAAEYGTEYISKIIKTAETAAVSAISAAATGAEIRVNTRMAKLIVTGAFFFIGKNFIGFVNLFKILFRGSITGV